MQRLGTIPLAQKANKKTKGKAILALLCDETERERERRPRRSKQALLAVLVRKTESEKIERRSKKEKERRERERAVMNNEEEAAKAAAVRDGRRLLRPGHGGAMVATPGGSEVGTMEAKP